MTSWRLLYFARDPAWASGAEPCVGQHHAASARLRPPPAAVFEVDDAGRVQRLKLDENYTYPVADWHGSAAGSDGY